MNEGPECVLDFPHLRGKLPKMHVSIPLLAGVDGRMLNEKCLQKSFNWFSSNTINCVFFSINII